LPKEALDALRPAPAVPIDGLNDDEIKQLSEADSSLADLRDHEKSGLVQ
jgi:hypothetical protein